MLNIRFDKKTAIITAGITLAIIIFILLTVPLIGKVGRIGREVKTLEREMASARQAIELQDKFQQTGNLLTRQEISLAIDEITKMGAKQDINFLSISPQKITRIKGVRYPVLPIRMDIQCGYRDLGLFLGMLEKLKKSIITIKSLEIQSNQQILPQIRTSLVVEVYLREGEDG